MTSTRSKVSRLTEHAYNVLYASGRNRRPIVVSILPGDVLEFREHGRRQRYLLAIDTAFRAAVRAKAFADMLEKKKAGKLRKKRR